MEAPTARDELEGNVAEVEAKVSCLPPVPDACLYGGGGIEALKYQSFPHNLSPPEVEHPHPPPPHVYIFHFDLSLFYFIAIRIQHFYSSTLSPTHQYY